MHSDEENGNEEQEEEEEEEGVSEREMLRLKTPSVGKLFNYLRYCGGVGRPEIRRGAVEKKGRGGGQVSSAKRWRKLLVAKPILIYAACELEFVNFHESPASLKGNLIAASAID